MASVAFAVGLLALAAWAVKRGFFPARQGDELRCRKCDYQLQGLASDRCPECGSSLLDDASVVKGSRHRRPLSIVVALLFLILGLGLTTIIVLDRTARIDWYQYKPTSWLISDIEKRSPAIDIAAWQELNRRGIVGTLSQKQLDRLSAASLASYTTPWGAGPSNFPWSELMRQDQAGVLSEVVQKQLVVDGLAEQRKPPSLLNPRYDLLRFLTEQVLAGKVTAEQRESFFANLMKFDVATRRTIRIGADLPYRLITIGNGPLMGYRYKVTIDEIRIDGKAIGIRREVADTTVANALDYSDYVIEGDRLRLRPGQHEMQMSTTFQFARNQGDQPPIREKTQDLKTTFRVLAENEPDASAGFADPSLQAAFQGSVSAEFTRQGGGDQVFVRVHVNNSPANYAFAVFAVANLVEYPIGSFSGSKSSYDDQAMGARMAADLSGFQSLDLILRGSDEVAAKTVGVGNPWLGELRIKAVPITVRP